MTSDRARGPAAADAAVERRLAEAARNHYLHG
jgi:hypothetical protein